MLELWGAEYQESNALLLRPPDRGFLERVCRREKCPVDFVGNITGDGKAGSASHSTDGVWRSQDQHPDRNRIHSFIHF